MKKLFILISLLLVSNTALAISLGDLKKTLEKATEEIKKEIEIPKEQNTETKLDDKKNDQQTENSNSKNLFVDDKISDQNIINLIYCKYDVTREILKNYGNFKVGDKINFIAYDFNTEMEIDGCSEYKPNSYVYYRSGNAITISDEYLIDTTNSSVQIDYKEYENYWLSKILNTNPKLKNMIGSEILTSSQIDGQAIEEKRVLRPKDLLSYCLIQNSSEAKSRNSKYRRVIFMTNYKLENAPVTSIYDDEEKFKLSINCDGKSFKQFIPVSKGKFSLVDVPGYDSVKNLTKKDEEQKLAAVKAKEDKEKERIENEQKRIEYENSPEGLLHRSYVFYIILEKLYNSRTSYAIQYITNDQFNEIKKKVKFIEDQAVNNHSINADQLWKKATETYKRDYAFSVDLVEQTGQYLNEGKQLSNLAIMDINYCYKEIGGSEEIKKSF